MAGRIAVDFGTSNTVIAGFDPVRQQGLVVPLSDYARPVKIGDDEINVVPSLIHYGVSGQVFYGNQVLQRNLAHSGRTLNWMKRYIAMRSPAIRKIDGKHVSYQDAAEEFLSRIFFSLRKELGVKDEDVALTVPVEAFEYYENWLYAVAARSGLANVRFIDESSAAALSYSSRLFPGEACLIFDCGAGSLNVTVMRQDQPDVGLQRLRVVGKAGMGFGGSIIDEWLFRELVHLAGYDHRDEEIHQISSLVLSECRALKERLSTQENSSFTVMSPLTGSLISHEYTRSQFERLLETNRAFAFIESTLKRALADAAERECLDSDIKMVLLVGGCSLIPSIQNLVQGIFGKDRVKIERPLDAVARGAAAFVAGQTFEDYLQHDYAIRHMNSETQQSEYGILIKRGTRYPSPGAITTKTIRAVNESQEDFVMQIFEMSDSAYDCTNTVEMLIDELGNASFNLVTKSELERRNLFWINENNPTLLRADPPAEKGEDRFKVSFSIDGNRRLLVTTRDLKTSTVLHQEFPVVKLS